MKKVFLLLFATSSIGLMCAEAVIEQCENELRAGAPQAATMQLLAEQYGQARQAIDNRLVAGQDRWLVDMLAEIQRVNNQLEVKRKLQSIAFTAQQNDSAFKQELFRIPQIHALCELMREKSSVTNPVTKAVRTVASVLKGNFLRCSVVSVLTVLSLAGFPIGFKDVANCSDCKGAIETFARLVGLVVFDSYLLKDLGSRVAYQWETECDQKMASRMATKWLCASHVMQQLYDERPALQAAGSLEQNLLADIRHYNSQERAGCVLSFCDDIAQCIREGNRFALQNGLQQLEQDGPNGYWIERISKADVARVADLIALCRLVNVQGGNGRRVLLRLWQTYARGIVARTARPLVPPPKECFSEGVVVFMYLTAALSWTVNRLLKTALLEEPSAWKISFEDPYVPDSLGLTATYGVVFLVSMGVALCILINPQWPNRNELMVRHLIDGAYAELQ